MYNLSGEIKSKNSGLGGGGEGGGGRAGGQYKVWAWFLHDASWLLNSIC